MLLRGRQVQHNVLSLCARHVSAARTQRMRPAQVPVTARSEVARTRHSAMAHTCLARLPRGGMSKVRTACCCMVRSEVLCMHTLRHLHLFTDFLRGLSDQDVSVRWRSMTV